MDPFACTVDREGDTVTVAVTGELSYATREDAIACVKPCLVAGATILMDCSRVSYTDSCGLSAMVWLKDAAAASGADFALVAIPPILARLLTLTGLTDYFASPEA